MRLLKLGVFGKSAKIHERRLPIHPDQLGWIDEDVKSQIFFEEGYGKHFRLTEQALSANCAGILPREELLKTCDIALMAKPTEKDFRDLPEGTIHWGWPHCVQQNNITQLAIEKKLTLIAWEAMHKWSANGDWQMHIFQKNNEIAGYAGVMHAMDLRGIDGNYGPNRKAVVLSFGSVSRGAIRALQARGVQNIDVYTQRHSILVASQMSGINYYQFDEDDGKLFGLKPNGESYPFIEALAEADIIVNGVLQDTDHPLLFVSKQDAHRIKKGALIADISCDEGMGFHFAIPTTFAKPMLQFGDFYYYAVDHTPSYLWDAATWEISNSLLPYLPIVMGGPDRWQTSETIRRAVEIKDGEIVNPKILTFQNREAEYPHPVKI